MAVVFLFRFRDPALGSSGHDDTDAKITKNTFVSAHTERKIVLAMYIFLRQILYNVESILSSKSTMRE